MAIRELQTAAARVMHLARPTDRDLTKLTNEFSLHPHDAEGILAVQSHNQLRPFRDYVLVQLLWPTYDRAERAVQAAEISFIVGPNRFVVADHGSLPPIESTIDGLMQPNGPNWQDRPEALLAGLLLKLAGWTEVQVQAFLTDQMTTVGDRDRQDYITGLEGLVASLNAFVELRQTQLDPETMMAFQLAIHRLRHQTQQLRSVVRAVSRPARTDRIQGLPKVVTSYAWASAVVVLVMLGWMIGKI